MSHTNRLIHEQSPYLLQHATNPVDWYPWGDEAIGEARRTGKPIFLSIGYSTCHWCHVMEHECFEDTGVAAVMNELYINIKVDREEHPDLDGIYMQASQALTGYGGWPLNMWLAPDALTPYYSGGYMPANPSGQHPGFVQVLRILSDQYQRDPAHVQGIGAQVIAMLNAHGDAATGRKLGEHALKATVQQAKQTFDAQYGGFGRAPKFPAAMQLTLLLRYASHSGDRSTLPLIEKTLDAMARGGIYDHLGGGFARYSTDSRWLVPHFEKMLYDNALLAMAYTEAFQVTGKRGYATTARETLDYVLRDMTSEWGGFFSAEDADSLPPDGLSRHKEEGAFYVFEQPEFLKAVGDDLPAATIGQFYGVTKLGNFEGRTILNVGTPLAEFCTIKGLDESVFASQLKTARQRLLEYRNKRPRPGLDDKVLTSWNGLMISAMAQGAIALEDPRYLEAARRAAEFVLAHLRIPEGGLLRRWREGHAALDGTLEDYAYFASSLLDLYDATLEPRWLIEAVGLAERMVELFAAAEGGFYLTAEGTPHLLVRQKDGYDNATPSGNSMAAWVCARLAELTADVKWRDLARGAVQAFGEKVVQMPSAFSWLLRAHLFMLAKPSEIVIVGDPADPHAAALIAVVREGYRPHRVLLLSDPALEAVTPLVRDRPMVDGRPTAYVCRDFACSQPVTSPEALRAQLA